MNSTIHMPEDIEEDVLQALRSHGFETTDAAARAQTSVYSVTQSSDVAPAHEDETEN